MTAPDRPCPSWCVDCSGWEGPDGVDGRVHRRRFAVRDSVVVEVYSMELLDGSTYEQGAETWEHEFATSADLRAYAAALGEAADLMTRYDIDTVTLDPARISSNQPAG